MAQYLPPRWGVGTDARRRLQLLRRQESQVGIKIPTIGIKGIRSKTARRLKFQPLPRLWIPRETLG
jgi:hypothetical protein